MACMAACSGDEFESGEELEGAGGVGGVGGAAVAPEAGPDGSAGWEAASDVPLPCNCAPGTYCSEASGKCVPCSDLSSLRFRDAVKVMGDATTSTPLFARELRSGDSTELFLRVSIGDEDANIVRATFPDLALVPFGGLIDSPDLESGPLPIPNGSWFTGLPAGSSGLVLFDGIRPMQEGMAKRQILIATVDGKSAVALPGVFNEGESDYSVAFAWDATPPRLWWTSTRWVQGPEEPVTATGLFTAVADGSGVANVPVTLPGACLSATADVAAWVLPDGSFMLLQSAPPGPSCTDQEGSETRLYAVRLDKSTGMPTGEAVELSDITALFADARTPSLSADRCELYFSAAGEGGYSLYRAARY